MSPHRLDENKSKQKSSSRAEAKQARHTQSVVIDADDVDNWGFEGRTEYIKNFSKKLNQMNRLLLNADNGVLDLDNYYDDLTKFNKLKAITKKQ